ncbi:MULTISPECIES: PAS domain-containing sensor histidine kinase [Ferrimonas]|uniref:sensor histidine kinase n=1 Tax=Ferrimonas TaxID=44011 RepID=UPI000408FB76|nr:MULTISPECIES: ATP-binding protein [Ferrimonas]USD38623.1 ATP-binding protein [Ferrimonas sp. SCSIO 43195]
MAVSQSTLASIDAPSAGSQAESRLNHLMHCLPAGVLLLDEMGVVEQANPAACELLEQPLQGKAWRQIIDSAFAPRADDGHEVSLKNGKRVSLKTRSLTPESGQLVMLTDLTETRRMQHNVSHLQRLSALGKMAASLAHQIRTPLSAALLYGANLASPKLDDAGRARFQQKLMARLGELEQRVNDLLLFARGGHTQKLEPLSVVDLIQELATSCEAALQQRQADLSWVFQASPHIEANVTALQGALQNLINNALEANANAIRITVSELKGRAVIQVADNGNGMTQEQQQQAMTPFYTTKANGTGLGLAVLHSICRAHDGTISLASLPGQGSQFTLTFPCLEQQEEQRA